MKQKKTILVIVVCAAALISIAVGHVLRSPEPPRLVDPYLASVRPATFDVVGALAGDFRIVHRFEELPLGLQQAVHKISGSSTPFIPKCVMANEDEPINTDFFSPGACTSVYFHFGGVNQRAAFIVYTAHNIRHVDGVIVFSLQNGGRYWEARKYSDASVQNLDSVRRAVANKDYEQVQPELTRHQHTERTWRQQLTFETIGFLLFGIAWLTVGVFSLLKPQYALRSTRPQLRPRYELCMRFVGAFMVVGAGVWFYTVASRLSQ